MHATASKSAWFGLAYTTYSITQQGNVTRVLHTTNTSNDVANPCGTKDGGLGPSGNVFVKVTTCDSQAVSYTHLRAHETEADL
eukprot:213400-Amphidinium_carterae.1